MDSSDAFLVPVIMSGAFDAMPYGDWRIKTGSHIDIRFGNPIDTIGLNANQVMEELKKVRVY
jgi:1-acyl-sn-glycerol-3-phosphate acyltransferase